MGRRRRYLKKLLSRKNANCVASRCSSNAAVLDSSWAALAIRMPQYPQDFEDWRGRATAGALDENCPSTVPSWSNASGALANSSPVRIIPSANTSSRKTTGVKCPRPGCDGDVVYKKSRRGKVFYGCANYPKCEIVYWDKPVIEACPQCQAPFLLEKDDQEDRHLPLLCQRRMWLSLGCPHRSGYDGAAPPSSQPRAESGPRHRHQNFQVRRTGTQ